MTKDMTRVVIGTLLVLLVPFLAMQFTDEVRWDAADFITIGALLMAAGSVYTFVISRLHNKVRRQIFGAALLLAVMLIWIELAVGILD